MSSSHIIDPLARGDPPTRISGRGTKKWLLNGELHRDADLPAVEYHDGEQRWYQFGVLTRQNGPAIITANNDRYWYLHGQLHRPDDMPAIECRSGDMHWYTAGKLHRSTGPAISSQYGNVWASYGRIIPTPQPLLAVPVAGAVPVATAHVDPNAASLPYSFSTTGDEPAEITAYAKKTAIGGDCYLGCLFRNAQYEISVDGIFATDFLTLSAKKVKVWAVGSNLHISIPSRIIIVQMRTTIGA